MALQHNEGTFIFIFLIRRSKTRINYWTLIFDFFCLVTTRRGMSTGKWSTWWCSLKRRMSFLAVCQPIAKWCTNSSVVTFSCRCVPKKPIKLSMKSSSTNWLAAGLKRLWIFSPPSHFNHASAFSFIVLKVLFLLFNFFLFFKLAYGRQSN